MWLEKRQLQSGTMATDEFPSDGHPSKAGVDFDGSGGGLLRLAYSPHSELAESERRGVGTGLEHLFRESARSVDGNRRLTVSSGRLLTALCSEGDGGRGCEAMAAIGAITGPGNWLYIFIATALLGGIASLALVLMRKRTAQTVSNISVILGQLAKAKQPSQQDSALSIHDEKALKMPHGAIIAAGVCLFLVLHWNA